MQKHIITNKVASLKNNIVHMHEHFSHMFQYKLLSARLNSYHYIYSIYIPKVLVLSSQLLSRQPMHPNVHGAGTVMLTAAFKLPRPWCCHVTVISKFPWCWCCHVTVVSKFPWGCCSHVNRCIQNLTALMLSVLLLHPNFHRTDAASFTAVSRSSQH